ncbi:hypothetical protein AAFF_G00365100 [Aldrovandia affinis]|uniref:Uncharacterized protein n=1 Tax=Aldrovandia affinis TaxID=143900 RepID=A0AAD7VZC0_9TELE|nr:hypothetical protein AAFF_G00365100 [Aldrovandia affinis]
MRSYFRLQETVPWRPSEKASATIRKNEVEFATGLMIVSHSQTMALRSIQQYLQAMQCHVGMVMQQPLWPHLDLMVFFT